LGQIVNTGLVTASLQASNSSVDVIPINAITQENYTTSGVFTVPANTKWLLVNASCGGALGGAYISIYTASGITAALVSSADVTLGNWHGLIVLVAGDRVACTRASQFTYYEVAA